MKLSTYSDGSYCNRTGLATCAYKTLTVRSKVGGEKALDGLPYRPVDKLFERVTVLPAENVFDSFRAELAAIALAVTSVLEGYLDDKKNDPLFVSQTVHLVIHTDSMSSIKYLHEFLAIPASEPMSGIEVLLTNFRILIQQDVGAQVEFIHVRGKRCSSPTEAFVDWCDRSANSLLREERNKLLASGDETPMQARKAKRNNKQVVTPVFLSPSYSPDALVELEAFLTNKLIRAMGVPQSLLGDKEL